MAFLRQNLHTFLFLDDYFRRFFYRERFIQMFEMFQHFLHFFHVNHEGIMNIDQTNTVFEVLLHYLQYASDISELPRVRHSPTIGEGDKDWVQG